MVSLEDGFYPNDILAMQHAENDQICSSFVPVHISL